MTRQIKPLTQHQAMSIRGMEKLIAVALEGIRHVNENRQAPVGQIESFRYLLRELEYLAKQDTERRAEEAATKEKMEKARILLKALPPQQHSWVQNPPTGRERYAGPAEKSLAAAAPEPGPEAAPKTPVKTIIGIDKAIGGSGSIDESGNMVICYPQNPSTVTPEPKSERVVLVPMPGCPGMFDAALVPDAKDKIGGQFLFVYQLVEKYKDKGSLYFLRYHNTPPTPMVSSSIIGDKLFACQIKFHGPQGSSIFHAEELTPNEAVLVFESKAALRRAVENPDFDPLN